MNCELKIRNMTHADIETLVSWTSEEGWIYSANDIKAFLKIDPTGVFTAEENGKIVGFMGMIKYEESYCFSPVYIVSKEARRKGYGTDLQVHASEYTKNVPIMGIDAVRKAVENRQGLGFEVFCNAPVVVKTAEGVLNSGLTDMRRVSQKLVDEYDLEVFGYPRNGFYNVLLEEDTTQGLAKIKDDKLIGYGMLRKMKKENSYSLGPVLADDKETAEEILEGLQSFVVGKDVYIQNLEGNQNWKEVFGEAKGWRVFSRDVRMYKGGIPKMNLSKVYGNFE